LYETMTGNSQNILETTQVTMKSKFGSVEYRLTLPPEVCTE